jgi:hypothetical protein
MKYASVPPFGCAGHLEEKVMDLVYIGLGIGFALLTFMLIAGCARLGDKK